MKIYTQCVLNIGLMEIVIMCKATNDKEKKTCAYFFNVINSYNKHTLITLLSDEVHSTTLCCFINA